MSRFGSRSIAACAGAILAALALASCRSSEPSAASDELVSFEDLPQEKRELIVAYGVGGGQWEMARELALAEPELAGFMVDNLVLEMLRGYDEYATRASEEGREACRRAQNELARMPELSVPVIVNMLRLNDGVTALLAAETLRRTGHPASLPVVALLADEDYRVRRRAAEVLAGLPNAGQDESAVREALIALAVSDEQWIVRAEAAATLGARGAHDRTTTPWRAALERLCADPDSLVAESAAKALGQLGDPLAIPTLARSLERGIRDGQLQLVRASQDALQELSGQRETLDPDGWKRWWGENAKRFQRTAPLPADAGKP